MTFAARIAAAQALEATVVDQLHARGWLADLFGQGQLPEHTRAHLRHFRTPVRWMPDIIACRTMPTGLKVIRYIDAKAGETWRRTGNHDIELAALEGAEQWETYSGHPVYYVFSGGCVVDIERVRDQARAGQFNDKGSGTPFILFTHELCVPFDAIFGLVTQGGAV